MHNCHSITEVSIHFVFVTKFRHIVNFTDSMLEIIEGISNRLNCEVLEINAAGNHVHVLVSLHPSISISEYACKIKSISSGMFSKEYKNWECWQRGYYAASVGTNSINNVKKYISEQ